MTKKIRPTNGSLTEKELGKTKKPAKAKKVNPQAFELSQEFLEDLENLFISGVPARDEKGHSTSINFRCRELQQDILAGVLERCPKEWFKSKSELSRSIFAIGCRVALEILNKNKSPQINELIKVMRDLNLISRAIRKTELEKEVSDLQNRILKNGGREREVFKLRRLKEQVKEII